MNIIEFETLFQNETGLELNSAIGDDGRSDTNKTERFVNKQREVLINEVKKSNGFFEYDDIPQTRKDEFDKILCVQIEYTLENGDLTNYNGIDTTNNSVIDSSNLSDMLVSPYVKGLLRSKGFLSRGVVW